MNYLLASFCIAIVVAVPADSDSLGPPAIAGCPIFPANNIWNTPVNQLPVDPHSAAWVDTIGRNVGLHPDFGSGLYGTPPSPIGIPYVTVHSSELTPAWPKFTYADESDPGPYPIPPNPPIEAGGDAHLLILDCDTCRLYELYAAHQGRDGSWHAGSGAIFDLLSNQLRPADWTSADAAGLPILPGLVTWDEVTAGVISHAIRFTAPKTRDEYIWPARHESSSHSGSQYPPMGARFRLKADFDTSGFSPENQVILQALKTYGMILADNGSPWYITGVPDDNWDNDDLGWLHGIKGYNFEAVDVSSLMVDPDSGEVVPEPGSLILFSSGLVGIVRLFQKARR